MDALPHIHFVLSHDQSLRLSGLNLNNCLDALEARIAILKRKPRVKTTYPKPEESSVSGGSFKLVRNITQKQKYLTPAEKDEVLIKYDSGMTMVAIADLYGCHHTTIGSILRKKGVFVC